MRPWTDSLRFAFQPVVNLATGAVAALEPLARPEHGDVVGTARRDPVFDDRLAAQAVRAAAEFDTMLPLHVNVFAATVARHPGGPGHLLQSVHEVGRMPWEVTIDLVPPFAPVPRDALLEGVAALRRSGFRVCVDGVGEGDLPLRLLAELRPDLVKLDASLLAHPAVVRSVRGLCEELGGLLAVEGVETEAQCSAAREAGAQLAQGDLLAPAARIPTTQVYVPRRHRPPAPAVRAEGPSVREFLRPAALLPLTARAGEVHALLTGSPDISGILLVDEEGRPVRSVHRDRFLLSLSGRYGHALYAERPAARLGDHPRTVGVDATAWEVLDVVAAGSRSTAADDVAVVDGQGRCVGLVRLADLVRALAESRVEEAVSLNPLTRMPGSDAITAEVGHRIAAERVFALCWLDIDHFKQVNDGAGFAAGDELIRSVGQALKRCATSTLRVGHIGGDDFLVLADPGDLAGLASAMLDAPWSAGGRAVSLSLATVVCTPGSVADHHGAAACLAPLKKAAKALSGSSWVTGRAGLPGHEVLRGTAAARVPSPAQHAAAPDAWRSTPGRTAPASATG